LKALKESVTSRHHHAVQRFGRVVLAQIIVAAMTFFALRLGANAATAGFAFLITILGIAVSTNLATSLISSVVATLCYNYFFFPPVGTFTIQEPANWVALVSFFIASIVASRLVLRARTQAEHAEARRKEVEALYALSIDLFTATNRVGALGEAAARALSNAGASGGGLVLFGSGTYDQRAICWSGPREEEIEDLIAGVGRHRRTLEFPAPIGRDVYLPLNIGGNIVGVLAARRTSATVRALESAATLVALAVERERFLSESAHMQALEEGDALKTSLLRAVSHDLATPLTAIALQIERLSTMVDEPARVVVHDIAEHTGRLRRRIENLLAMARLEARSVVPRPEPTPAADLFRAVREHLPLVVQNRRIDVRVDPECPDVYVDPSIALEILANLIENAHQASPAELPIELSAFRHPLDPERVRLEVADRGSGLRPETSRDTTNDPSDTPRRGLGLEIARSLSSASGGQVTLANRPGGGAIARVDLLAAYLPAIEEVRA
jgi:two-component system, OmpR family, sensor histidine kinase KdpD